MDSRLTVIVDSRAAETGSRKVVSSLKKVENAAKGMTGKVDGGFAKLTRNLFSIKGAIATLGIGAFVKKSVGAFVELSSGLVGVSKTTGITGDALKELKKNIVDMTKRIPASQRELFGIAQAAGQLGIKGTDNITKFTETIAKLGAASDLAGEEGSITLARILGNTREDIDTVDRFASVLVRLGNESKTSESQIAKMSIELSKATTQFGVSSTNLAALGTTLSSFGQQAELARSTTLKTFLMLKSATQEGGKRLQILASLTGQTGEQFKKTFEKDSFGAFVKFIGGLKQVQDAGGNSEKVLKALKLNGTGINSVLPLLATNFDVLQNKISTANDEFKKNTALNKEADAAFSTLGSKLIILKNNLTSAFSIIGEALAPGIEILSNKVIALVNSGAVEKIASVLGVAFTFLAENIELVGLALSALAIGRVVRLFSTFFGIIKAGHSPIKTIMKSFQLLGVSTHTVATGMRIAGLAFRFMTGPIGLVLGAISGLIGLYQLYKDELVTIGDKTVSIGNLIQGAWNVVVQFISNTFGKLGGYIVEVFTFLVEPITDTFNVITAVVGKLYEIFEREFGSIGDIVKDFLKKPFAWVLKRIKKFVNDSIERFLIICNAPVAIGKAIIRHFTNAFERVKELGSGFVDGVSRMFTDFEFDFSEFDASLKKGFMKPLTNVIDDVKGELGAFKRDYVGDFIKETVEEATTLAERNKPKKTKPSEKPEPVKPLKNKYEIPKINTNDVNGATDTVKGELKHAEDLTKKFISGFENNFTQGLSNAFKNGKNGWRDMLDGFKNLYFDTLTELTAKPILDALFGKAGEGGSRGGGGMFGKMIGNFFGKATAATDIGKSGENFFSGIGDFLSGSSSGGGFGGMFSGIGDMFGGFFADGGTLRPGQWGIAGERGPEPIFAGNMPLNVMPNSKTKGRNITVNMNIQTQDAGSFKKSHGQIASEMAAAVKRAERNL
nr:hypothetical protein 7 [bacterium]